jgi:hypothetical protein
MISYVNANIQEIKADDNNKNELKYPGTQSIKEEEKEIFHNNSMAEEQVFNGNNIEDLNIVDK